MATKINPSIFLYTEKDIAAELSLGGMEPGKMRNFIASYASLLKTQSVVPSALEEITVRIDGIDLRIDAIDLRIDDVESIAYMALLT